jgi:hypothetical protein
MNPDSRSMKQRLERFEVPETLYHICTCGSTDDEESPSAVASRQANLPFFASMHNSPPTIPQVGGRGSRTSPKLTIYSSFAPLFYKCPTNGLSHIRRVKFVKKAAADTKWVDLVSNCSSSLLLLKDPYPHTSHDGSEAVQVDWRPPRSGCLDMFLRSVSISSYLSHFYRNNVDYK